jgi:hypothetical protein
MVVASGELARTVSPVIAALVLGTAVILPTAVYPFMPVPGPDRRLAAESFGQFFGELLKLSKRREVLIAVVIFIAPAGTFSLTNFLAGVGDDFHASSHFVSLVGGAGVSLAAIAGCLLFSVHRSAAAASIAIPRDRRGGLPIHTSALAAATLACGFRDRLHWRERISGTGDDNGHRDHF